MMKTTQEKSDEKKIIKIVKETAGNRFSWILDEIKINGGKK